MLYRQILRLLLLAALFSLFAANCSKQQSGVKPGKNGEKVIPLLPGDTLFRFVHKNESDKTKGWKGRDSDWTHLPKGVSVFRNLTPVEYRAMADAHAQDQGWDPTDVAFVVEDSIAGIAVFTADPIPPNGTWTDPGAAKHGVLNGAGADTTFKAFGDSVAPKLAKKSGRIYRGTR